jgi:hypothetical protein
MAGSAVGEIRRPGDPGKGRQLHIINASAVGASGPTTDVNERLKGVRERKEEFF